MLARVECQRLPWGPPSTQSLDFTSPATDETGLGDARRPDMDGVRVTPTGRARPDQLAPADAAPSCSRRRPPVRHRDRAAPPLPPLQPPDPTHRCRALRMTPPDCELLEGTSYEDQAQPEGDQHRPAWDLTPARTASGQSSLHQTQYGSELLVNVNVGLDGGSTDHFTAVVVANRAPPDWTGVAARSGHPRSSLTQWQVTFSASDLPSSPDQTKGLQARSPQQVVDKRRRLHTPSHRRCQRPLRGVVRSASVGRS